MWWPRPHRNLPLPQLQLQLWLQFHFQLELQLELWFQFNFQLKLKLWFQLHQFELERRHAANLQPERQRLGSEQLRAGVIGERHRCSGGERRKHCGAGIGTDFRHSLYRERADTAHR